MKGIYPTKYFGNPNIDKEQTIEQIWDDIEAYSGEYFEDEIAFHNEIDFFIPLPPLLYKNKMTKGIAFSQGCEYLLKLFPKVKDIFFIGAYTMWSSYSWCDKVDFYLSCYKNEKRENYHKLKHQNKKDIIFIPLQDADYTNEYKMAPIFDAQKTIDVLSISTPIPVKNLPVLALAIRKYEEKYGKILNTTIVLGRKEVIINENGIDYSMLPESEKEQLNLVCKILNPINKYVNFKNYVNYKELAKLYSSSKCLVLNSLIEGKNRSINEAISCDTPAIVFKNHNQWARGGYPIFTEKCGEEVPYFHPESLADTIYKVINNPQNYNPREEYLIYNGRKNFIDNLTTYIPYYSVNIPNYNKTKFHQNLWIDLACQKNYQISYLDFLYDKNPTISHVRGIPAIKSLIQFYYSRFGIK